MNVKVPCKQCQKRYLGCHSVCDEYKAYRVNMDAIKENRNKDTEQREFMMKVRTKR